MLVKHVKDFLEIVFDVILSTICYGDHSRSIVKILVTSAHLTFIKIQYFHFNKTSMTCPVT